jgi:hypothetical protein
MILRKPAPLVGGQGREPQDADQFVDPFKCVARDRRGRGSKPTGKRCPE